MFFHLAKKAGRFFLAKTVTGLIFLAIFASVSLAGHFSQPVHTISFCDYIGAIQIEKSQAQPGDEIAFFDPDGVCCGLFDNFQSASGLYGVVHVYGDDPTTAGVDEGARPGDQLSVRIWSSITSVEYSKANVGLFAGEPTGQWLSSQTPPVWASQGAFVLDIKAEAQPGDMNNDGRTGLADAIYALQIISGIDQNSNMPKDADTDGDGKPGMQDILYVLRETCSLGGGK